MECEGQAQFRRKTRYDHCNLLAFVFGESWWILRIDYSVMEIRAYPWISVCLSPISFFCVFNVQITQRNGRVNWFIRRRDRWKYDIGRSSWQTDDSPNCEFLRIFWSGRNWWQLRNPNNCGKIMCIREITYINSSN